MNPLAEWIGGRLGRWLSREIHVHGTSRPTPMDLLVATLQPGDVLLVEGHSRVSVAIKYLTQSTWSHAALYVGDQHDRTTLRNTSHEPACFVEADIVEGVRLVGVSEFSEMHTRICRPMGLSAGDIQRVIDYALTRVGLQYDLKNVIDLARYMIPTPPVPTRWRRRMLSLGSGDPTRAICSTLVAQCFQSIRYPILPIVTTVPSAMPDCPECVNEIYQVRHHSLFVPRDFDVSPYFRVVKPTVEAGFDHRQLHWEDQGELPVSHQAGSA